MKMPHKLRLEKKLVSEHDALVMNSQDLSLLKLTNPALYRRKHYQQLKAKSNIRKAIESTKEKLNKLE